MIYMFIYLLARTNGDIYRGIALALIPVFPMIIKGVELTVLHGVILSVLWMVYSLIVCSPLYVAMCLTVSVFRK